MLSILDRYLLRQYFQVLLICFCSLMGLFAVIDALGHLDQFTAHAQSSHMSVLVAIGQFYGYQSLSFFDRTSGILAMMAAMFTMAWFKRNNELTAVMAAGISQLRAATPLLIAAAAISIVAAGSREIILPALRSELLRSTKDLAGADHRPLRAWYDAQTGILLRGEAIVAAGKRIIRPVLQLPTNPEGVVQEVAAAEARYTAATGNHPAGYLLIDVASRAVDLTQPTIQFKGHDVLYTPAGRPWLEEGQAFWVGDVEFDQLAAGTNWRHFASTAELVDYVKRPASDVPTSAYVTLHGRFVRPILDVSLVVVGLSLVLSRRGRSPFVAVALAMALVAGFLVMAIACEFLGNSAWIAPSLAAWLPLFLFVPLAVAAKGVLRR